MDNYFYYLRELIDSNRIYKLDKRNSNKKGMETFLDKFSNEIES